jgi:hypothetical protein
MGSKHLEMIAKAEDWKSKLRTFAADLVAG